ncbi:MAG TPA: hypothetical protein VNK82_09905 [Terriglobales bacterium]|nr:hypothetical protein [Terriglobales bacterium]
MQPPMFLSKLETLRLLELVFHQQREIVLLKAGMGALLRIAQEAGIADAVQRFQGHSAAEVSSASLENPVQALHLLEQAILRLKAETDPVN